MPLYDYECDHCGPFRDWGSMKETAMPADCPACGDLAPRTISAPFIAGMNPYTRNAHQRNEKSADSPQEITKTTHDHGRRRLHRRAHGAYNDCVRFVWRIGFEPG